MKELLSSSVINASCPVKLSSSSSSSQCTHSSSAALCKASANLSCAFSTFQLQEKFGSHHDLVKLLPLARIKNLMNRSARVSSTQPVSISLRSSALLIRSLDSFDLVDDYNTDIHSLPPPQLFKGVALSCNPHEK